MEVGESGDGLGRPARSVLMNLYVSALFVPAGAMSQLTECPMSETARR